MAENIEQSTTKIMIETVCDEMQPDLLQIDDISVFSHISHNLEQNDIIREVFMVTDENCNHLEAHIGSEFYGDLLIDLDEQKAVYVAGGLVVHGNIAMKEGAADISFICGNLKAEHISVHSLSSSSLDCETLRVSHAHIAGALDASKVDIKVRAVFGGQVKADELKSGSVESTSDIHAVSITVDKSLKTEASIYCDSLSAAECFAYSVEVKEYHTTGKDYIFKNADLGMASVNNLHVGGKLVVDQLSSTGDVHCSSEIRGNRMILNGRLTSDLSIICPVIDASHIQCQHIVADESLSVVTLTSEIVEVGAKMTANNVNAEEIYAGYMTGDPSSALEGVKNICGHINPATCRYTVPNEPHNEADKILGIITDRDDFCLPVL